MSAKRKSTLSCLAELRAAEFFFFQFLLEIGCILVSFFSVVYMMWILLCNMLFPYLLRRKYGLTTMWI